MLISIASANMNSVRVLPSARLLRHQKKSVIIDYGLLKLPREAGVIVILIVIVQIGLYIVCMTERISCKALSYLTAG